MNQYRAWSNYSVINYDDDIGGTWGTPGAANGVLMQDGNVTAGYNALNQPTVIGSAATWATGNWIWFGFDPLGRCVKRTTGPSPDSGVSTYFYYDGWNLVQEGPANQGPTTVYAHGARVDEIIASSHQQGQIVFHHYDAQGNCILLSDWMTGNIIEQYDYEAFGKPYVYDAAGAGITNAAVLPWNNRFLFTGREWLRELRLYDYRNRMYQPELGRFLQPDPKHFAAGDYNLYRYCHNDPVNKSDPTGLDVSALPYWDKMNIFLAKFWGYAERWHNGESSDRLLVSAHGARGGAMNTSVTEEVKNAAKTINDVPASMQWTPEQIAEEITKDGEYKVDSIIELDICFGADRGPDGKSLQEKVAALLPSTNKVEASHGLVRSADGKASNGTPRSSLPGQKNTDDKKKK